MATFLAYTSPAAGHLFPLMPGLLALRERGHDVHVRTDADLVDAVRAAGLQAEAVDPAILDVPIRDYEARRDTARLRRGLHDLIGRGPLEIADLRRAIEETRPDALIIDTNAYGAAVAAATSGLPWAISLPSLVPFPGRGIPPYGLGLKPRRDLIGRARDAVLWPVVVRQFGRSMLPRLNALRASAGLPPLDHPLGHLRSADLVLAMTSEPLEYPRDEVPPRVRFVGAQNWDPPASPTEAPA
jgi:UDP:flavonoid glycosyltransferase YjiC (YdhE family)